MKARFVYLILIFAFLGACKKDKPAPVIEVPVEIIRTVANPTLYSKIVEMFPAGQDALINYPFLFSDTVQKNIVLTAESEVYVTFIAESATYRNTVGWYSYNLGNKPGKIKDIDIHLLFPNVSGKGEGGELLQGDMLQLGDQKFPKGTVIGFFLIIDGWHDGTINYKGVTHYTDYNLNSGGHQQHALFIEKNSKDIILGFEDMLYEQADADYNDILMKISDNKDGYEIISFDLAKLPVL